MKSQESFNGWKNYETWNVSLWISNDEGLYDLAKACKHAVNPYECFTYSLKEVGHSPISFETPDNVPWNDSGLDIDALNEMIGEL